MTDEFPKSKNIGRWATDKYFITAASWEPSDQFGPSYEIGIRAKGDGHRFALIQGDFDENTVSLAAQAVVTLLNAGWEIDSVRRVIR